MANAERKEEFDELAGDYLEKCLKLAHADPIMQEGPAEARENFMFWRGVRAVTELHNIVEGVADGTSE